jgi:hypothetical protein
VKALRKTLLLLFSLSSLALRSQTEMMDTLKSAMHHTPKPYGTFGDRNSFVQNSRADIWGFKLGLSYNKRVRFSVGYNFMITDLTQPLAFPDPAGKNGIVTMHMKLRYFSTCFEYVYYKTPHWEFSIPVQAGIGNSKYVFNYDNAPYSIDNRIIVLYEPMVQSEYYIFPWLGVEADVGLRLMLKNNRAIGKNFNSPMYAFGMFIAWDELYKTIFPNTRFAGKM